MFICGFKKVGVILLILVHAAQCVTTANDLFIQEGEDADIKFSYHTVAPVEFELRVGHKDPFFQYGQIMADGLTHSQQKRLRVNSWHSMSEEHMLVHLKFTGVERTDAGAYTCTLIENGKIIINSTQTISLSIDFPPGAVKCWVSSQTEYECDLLQCAALGGSPPGKISCFQNNLKALPYGIDHANGTHILKKIWFDKNIPVFCCSHSDIDIQWEDCNDFVKWFPDTKYGGGPFPTKLSFETSQQSLLPILKQTLSCPSNDSNKRDVNERLLTFNIIYIVIVLVCTVILVLLIVFLYCKFFRKSGLYTPVNVGISDHEKNENDVAKCKENYETELCVDEKVEIMEMKEGIAKDKRVINWELMEKENAKGDHAYSKQRSPPQTTEHDPGMIGKGHVDGECSKLNEK